MPKHSLRSSVRLCVVLAVLLAAGVVLADRNTRTLLHSFHTKKNGKHALGLIINIGNLNGCDKGVGIVKNKIKRWRRYPLAGSRMVLLTVVIRKKHMEECKQRVTRIYRRDKQLESLLKDLEFKVTIIENRES